MVKTTQPRSITDAPAPVIRPTTLADELSTLVHRSFRRIVEAKQQFLAGTITRSELESVILENVDAILDKNEYLLESVDAYAEGAWSTTLHVSHN